MAGASCAASGVRCTVTVLHRYPSRVLCLERPNGSCCFHGILITVFLQHFDSTWVKKYWNPVWLYQSSGWNCRRQIKKLKVTRKTSKERYKRRLLFEVVLGRTVLFQDVPRAGSGSSKHWRCCVPLKSVPVDAVGEEYNSWAGAASVMSSVQ